MVCCVTAAFTPKHLLDSLLRFCNAETQKSYCSCKKRIRGIKSPHEHPRTPTNACAGELYGKRVFCVTALQGKKTENMNEKLIEQRLRKATQRLGGVAMKWVSPGYTGVPDRLVLLPGGVMVMVELKSTGAKPTARQLLVHGMLRGLGFDVRVIDSPEGVHALELELLNRSKPTT